MLVELPTLAVALLVASSATLSDRRRGLPAPPRVGSPSPSEYTDGRRSPPAPVELNAKTGDFEPHLRWMSFFDPPPLGSLSSWVNLLHMESIDEIARTFDATGVPSLVTLTVNGSSDRVDPAVAVGQGASLLCSLPCASCGHDRYVLCDDWPRRLRSLGELLKPHLASKAVRGVFIGDELLHMSLGYSNLVNLSLALRAELGSDAILYANMEGSWLTNDSLFPRVPESWDLVSADDYWNREHSNPATAGFEASANIYTNHLLPKLSPHQRALMVPGTFASRASVPQNDTEVVVQLQRFWDFALNDSRICGFDPWHYYNRSGALDASSVEPYAVGAEAMPKTLALLRQIGAAIVAGKPPPTSPRGAPPLPPPLDPPLEALIEIDWELLYPLPVGVEDNDGGWVDDSTVVTGFGLSKHSYPGCVSTAYSYNVSDPLAKWQELPIPPVAPRQEEAATIVTSANGGSEVWYCGGFNNDWKAQGNKQRTMDDMLRLYRDGPTTSWKWEVLPIKLPYPLDGHAVAAIGHLLYLFGGDLNEGSDTPPGVGKMLHVLDTRNLSFGWKRLTDCPGHSKSGVALAPVQGKLFVLGSSSDSWEYAPSADAWTRLPDMPLPNPVKLGGSPAFLDRFILAIGGAANFNATGTSGPFAYPARPSFMPRNTTCNCTADSNPNKPGINYWGYDNAVLVYDTVNKKWGTIESTSSKDPELLGPGGMCGPFPLNVCLPQVSVRGDKIVVVGGEADTRVVHGHSYGHLSDMAVLGRMRAK